MNKLVLAAVILAAVLGYRFGSTQAQARHDAELIERLQAHQKQQAEQKAHYEKTVTYLTNELNRVRNVSNSRMRQLEKFTAARTDLETCARERADLAKLAVEGEGLLGAADAYLKALTEGAK